MLLNSIRPQTTASLLKKAVSLYSFDDDAVLSEVETRQMHFSGIPNAIVELRLSIRKQPEHLLFVP